MKNILILLISCFAFTFPGKTQNVKKDFFGVWTQQQMYISSYQWLFNGNEICTIHSWANGSQLGGGVRKGNFEVDSINKILKIKWSSYFDIQSQEQTNRSNTEEEWNIVKTSSNEIVLSRPRKQGDAKAAEGEGDLFYVHLSNFIKSRLEPTIASANK